MPARPPAGEPQPCTHPQARHQHGTEQAYISDRCRCQPCRDAHATKASQRRKNIAYGRWQPALVPNIGSRRRIEALACNGWSMAQIAPMTGCTARSLHRLFEDGVNYIDRLKAERITRVYNELWDQPAPQTTKGAKIGARRVLLIAKTRGYAPPLAWDEDTIDDPAALPTGDPEPTGGISEIEVRLFMAGLARPTPATGRGNKTTDEVVEAVRRLAQMGLTDSTIGLRIGSSKDAVNKIRQRNNISSGQPSTAGIAA